MSAPINNTNRLGRIGIPYQLTAPRLKCDTCQVKDACPFYKPGTPVCVFLKRVRSKKAKLNSIEDVQDLRRQVILDTLVQLEVGGMAQGANNSKEMLLLRKLAMEQLKELERDMFTQSMKKVENNGGSTIAAIIAEIRSKPVENKTTPSKEQIMSEEYTEI